MVATQHDNNVVATQTLQHTNIVAEQNMVQTLLGTDNITKGKKVETTIHHMKQPQVSVRVIESLYEEMEIKLSSLSVCCSSFQSLATVN